ncbi:MAG: DEAD/DEAH box helicase [Chamaesiphon sp.]|nr:DEAD/DEAH box helicase [Chamaesiphon sp.]
MTTSATTTALLQEIFPFPLDKFQLQAVDSLNLGRSVVVCAPTGSGKTLIGEYAIHRAIRQGRRVFYTTPLKALSNQKFRDFKAEFGEENVGLLTGDISINRDALVVVMTTEIFRNMLYGTRIGEVGTSMMGVEAVVLDECHYMNDKQRGTVWEESIIYCPPHIQLVGLSATVANSKQLTDWISLVHGPTDLIYSDYRPVPLEFHFVNPKGILPLLDPNTAKLNPKLKSHRPPGSRKQEDIPSIGFVVSKLAEREMLPAIYFIFSRRGCDKAVADMATLRLVNEDESARLKVRIDEFLAKNPEAARAGQVEPLNKGIAAHHAGILPAWKVLVEELFTQGLIKVVFATETLAAGINMPARTTVISSLSKRTDQGHRLLTASEFLQMAGRAGRRGKDVVGYVVATQTRFEGAKEASDFATSAPDPLVSQFTPTYGMVLNLLQTHNLEEARELVERSFGQFTKTLHLQPQQQGVNDIKRELSQLQESLGKVDGDVLADYETAHSQLKLDQNQLKNLQLYTEQIHAGQVSKLLPAALPGTILSLKGKHVSVATPLPAVLVSKIAGSGYKPALVCLGQDNRWYVVNHQDVVAVHKHWSDYTGKQRVSPVVSLLPPADMPLKPGQVRKGMSLTAEIAQSIPHVEPPATDELAAQLKIVAELKSKLENHPIWAAGNPATLLKRYRRQFVLEEEIKDLQNTLQLQLDRHWQEFLNLIEVLRQVNGLQGVLPTRIGEAAAAIRGDNELWIALALMSGYLDGLDPHHLAAVICALVSETPRSDSWTNYEPADEVVMTLSALRGTRRQLFQIQRRYQVALPVWMEYELVGIVEHWALELSWTELCSNTNLDEGDIVRMLRRTVDLLSQIPYVPHASAALQANARRAIQLIDRFPINESIS